MSHEHHEGPEDAVFYDGCAECDKRASDPMNALLNLDATNVDRLWRRMLNVEKHYGDARHGTDTYRSTNEARVGKYLYLWAVFEERHSTQPDRVWRDDRYAVPVA